MVAQFGEGFPGLTITEGKTVVDTTQDLNPSLEAIYTAYLEGNADAFPISPAHSAGLHEFLKLDRLNPLAVKGQVIGPISFGLSIRDSSGKAILYDETLSDAAAKLLCLKASWQEARLRHISPRTIIFVDEPGLVSYGSAFFNLPREQVVALINDTLIGISGLKGIHCCGNTDWGLVTSTKTDILSFDAYNYSASLSLFLSDVHGFLARGGAIAWGIIPTDEALAKESVASLKDRLEEAMAPFTRQGISFAHLKEHALLTPACGLAALSEDEAEQALKMLTELSARMRGKAVP
jgi:methionine synthase II (cobalamin-independent)